MAPRVQAGGQGLRSHRPTEGSGGLESRYDRQGEQQEEVEELPPPHLLSVEPLTESRRAGTKFKRTEHSEWWGSGLHDRER